MNGMVKNDRYRLFILRKNKKMLYEIKFDNTKNIIEKKKGRIDRKTSM